MVCITYVISCYCGSNTSSCILLHHIASSCIAFHRLASSCIVLHYLASSCIVLQRLAASSHHVTNIQIRSQKQIMSQHIFWLNPTSVEGSKTFINELRSSATGSQFRLECVCTPPAVARTRSSSFRISSKARLSHSLPCETAPRRSSSNLAADASSTYGIRHTATTKPPSSYNIAPCDKHSNSLTKTNHVTTHFLVEPNLRGGFQDFHQRVAQLCYGQPIPVGMCLHTTRSSQDSKLLFSHFVQSTTQPLLALWNSSKAKFFQFGSRCLVHLRHPTHCHHKTTIILQHRTMWQTCNFRHNPILPHRTCMRGAKTSSNRARSSPTASHLLSGPRPTFRACAILRSSITEIFARASWSHPRPLVTALLRSSCNRISTASSTYSIRHTATTKQQSSYNIAPCDKHATFVTILFCPTGPACVVPRHPAIERAALQPQATCCPVHGQHSEHVPFCEAPSQKFVPGHPGAIHDPWSQHCYAAPATEFPRHRTTRMTRSHAPFAQTFPSANETATTKRSQTSRVRDFNQTFCIQKFRDMHICWLAFKTMPWHAWFQNKIERYKIERYNDSRSIFCPLLMHFNENITYIFFVLYIT